MMREVFWHFLSLLIVISAIFVISQLVRISDILVTFGITFENVFLPFLFIILPFVPMIVPIAYLFAVLLTFSRLSIDGEYAAIVAAGRSLRNLAVPVIIKAVFLYFIAAFCSMHLEAWGRREIIEFYYRKTQTEVDSIIKFKIQPGVFLQDFLGYVLYTEKISADRTRFDNLMIAPGGKDQGQKFLLFAPSGHIQGSVSTGDLKLILDFGVGFSSADKGSKSSNSSVLKFQHGEIDLLRVFHEQIVGSDEVRDDFRSYPPDQLSEFVDKLRQDPQADKKTYYKANFLYHKRISSPFAVVIFALFGIVLGVVDPRKGKNRGYMLAILTIVGGYVVMMLFEWFAKHGHLPGIVAAWMPHAFMLLFGMFLLYQKNRLPPSESPLDPAHFPRAIRWPKMHQ